MDKKDGILFIAGGALEFIGWGVGMISHIPEQVGYVAVGIGVIVLVIAVIRFVRYKPVYPTWQELQARGEAKRWYLEPLQNNINAVTTKYKELFKTAVDNTAKYLNDKDKKDIISSAKTIGRFFLNNPYYSELKKSSTMDELRNGYEELYSHIKDKKLKSYLKKLWICEHQAKSVQIFYETLRIHYENIPERVIRIYGRQETPIREYQNALNRVNERIDDLLGGVPDEQ